MVEDFVAYLSIVFVIALGLIYIHFGNPSVKKPRVEAITKAIAVSKSLKPRSEEEIAAAEKAQVRQYWLEVERNRKSREQFESAKIPGWMLIGPVISSVFGIVFAGWIYFSEHRLMSVEWWVIGIATAPFLFLAASDIEGAWEASLDAKREVDKEKGGTYSSQTGSDKYKVNGFSYKHNYAYTDSIRSYWGHIFLKALLSIYTLVVGSITVSFLIYWLWPKLFRPTTIIIILLILILLKLHANSTIDPRSPNSDE